MLSAAATAPAAGGRAPRTFTREELAKRADALALRMGTKLTASTVLLAAVVVILVGAQSLLGSMEAMERDVREMNKQLAIANVGVTILNETMDSVPPTAEHMGDIVATVKATSKEAKVSSAKITAMAGTTAKVNEQLGSIAASTGAMRGSLQSAATDTSALSKTIATLNQDIGPLVKTQHELLQRTKRMRTGMDGMNASLAYVVRVLNYITAPPTGAGMKIRADMPKQTLPPIPGIKAEVEPIDVFPRNIWPVYTGR